MAKSAAPHKHLRIYTEQPPKDVRSQIEAVACLPDLLRAFEGLTGWSLQYLPGPLANQSSGSTWFAPICVGPPLSPGALSLEPPKHRGEGERGTEEKAPGPEQQAVDHSPLRPKSAARRRSTVAAELNVHAIDGGSVRRLAGSIADVLSELFETRRVLWQREAELAAGVPLVAHREEEKHLASRLEAVLRAGAEAVGADAIALYLLDEATSELKLRSAWGLPFDRLAAPARPLQGAVADLEALLGHAVVLDNDQVMQMWNVPEDCPAAVCVPVSTPTALLGTLWVFCNERRDFRDSETNMLEVVAGRLAADLEREMLMRAGADGAKLQKQVAAAERLQRNALPTISPLLDGWSVAGWTGQAEGVGGAFHDWFCLPRGMWALAVGKAAQQGVAGALTANAVKTAVRAHAQYHLQSERILQQVNLTLWTGSAGDQQASLFCGLVETATGRVCCASGGQVSVVRLHDNAWEPLGQASAGLGESPETAFEQFGYELQPGEVLVIFTDNLRNAADGENRPSSESGLAAALRGKLHLSAEELVVAAREALSAQLANPDGRDLSVLVVKRAD